MPRANGATRRRSASCASAASSSPSSCRRMRRRSSTRSWTPTSAGSASSRWASSSGRRACRSERTLKPGSHRPRKWRSYRWRVIAFRGCIGTLRPMTLLKWLVAAALIYGAFVALLYFAQRGMMYFPDRTRTPPATVGLPQAEEVTLTAADGEKLIAWHVRPADGRPVILYFQGNGGGPNLRARRFRNLAADGLGLLALCYRGYGGSTGSPSEAGLLLDAAAAYEFA